MVGIKHLRKLVLLSILLAACDAAQTAPVLPTQPALTISMPSELFPIQGILRFCAKEEPKTALFILESTDQVLSPDADLTLRLAYPEEVGIEAALLAWEDLAIIVHPDNPVSRLSIGEVKGLFNGKIGTWNEVGGPNQDVEVWIPPEGNSLRDLFDGAVLRGNPSSTHAYLAPSPSAMLEAIGDNPGAIGYLPKAWLTSAVNTISLDQIPDGTLRFPVLALSNGSPEGTARSFLACLQSNEAQSQIVEKYLPIEISQ